MNKRYGIFLGILAIIGHHIMLQATTTESPIIPYYNTKVAYYFACKEKPFFGATTAQKENIATLEKKIKDLHIPIYTLRGENLAHALTIIQNIINTLNNQIHEMLETYYANKHNLKIQKQTQSFFTHLKKQFKKKSTEEQLADTEKEALKKQIIRAQEEYKIARHILYKLQNIGAKYKNYLTKKSGYTKGKAELNETVQKEYAFFKAHGFWPQPIQKKPELIPVNTTQNPIKAIFNGIIEIN